MTSCFQTGSHADGLPNHSPRLSVALGVVAPLFLAPGRVSLVLPIMAALLDRAAMSNAREMDPIPRIPLDGVGGAEGV